MCVALTCGGLQWGLLRIGKVKVTWGVNRTKQLNTKANNSYHALSKWVGNYHRGANHGEADSPLGLLVIWTRSKVISYFLPQGAVWADGALGVNLQCQSARKVSWLFYVFLCNLIRFFHTCLVFLTLTSTLLFRILSVTVTGLDCNRRLIDYLYDDWLALSKLHQIFFTGLLEHT